jgi:serine protease inhibitor
VSEAVHQAVIEVDEQGTEAAAATAAVISLTSMPMEEPEPLVLDIDRPFLFAIRARASGAVLFVGQFVQP